MNLPETFDELVGLGLPTERVVTSLGAAAEPDLLKVVHACAFRAAEEAWGESDGPFNEYLAVLERGSFAWPTGLVKAHNKHMLGQHAAQRASSPLPEFWAEWSTSEHLFNLFGYCEEAARNPLYAALGAAYTVSKLIQDESQVEQFLESLLALV